MPSESPVNLKKVTINKNRRPKISSDKDSVVIKCPGVGIKLPGFEPWLFNVLAR